MTQPAYDECYLDMMFQKTRYLFKLIARNCQDAFSVMATYLEGEYRERMDRGNPLYLNKTPKQILGNMKVKVDFNAEISDIFDEAIVERMADIYTYLQWSSGIVSKEIVRKIAPEELYKKYSPLHETSIKNGCEKLRKIYAL